MRKDRTYLPDFVFIQIAIFLVVLICSIAVILNISSGDILCVGYTIIGGLRFFLLFLLFV